MTTLTALIVAVFVLGYFLIAIESLTKINKAAIALLMFVPLVNFVMAFVLGAKGNEWAWRNKKWDSVEHFKAVQRKWAIAGLIILIVWVLLGVAVVMMTPSALPFVK